MKKILKNFVKNDLLVLARGIFLVLSVTVCGTSWAMSMSMASTSSVGESSTSSIYSLSAGSVLSGVQDGEKIAKQSKESANNAYGAVDVDVAPQRTDVLRCKADLPDPFEARYAGYEKLAERARELVRKLNDHLYAGIMYCVQERQAEMRREVQSAQTVLDDWKLFFETDSFGEKGNDAIISRNLFQFKKVLELFQGKLEKASALDDFNALLQEKRFLFARMCQLDRALVRPYQFLWKIEELLSTVRSGYSRRLHQLERENLVEVARACCGALKKNAYLPELLALDKDCEIQNTHMDCVDIHKQAQNIGTVQQARAWLADLWKAFSRLNSCVLDARLAALSAVDEKFRNAVMLMQYGNVLKDGPLSSDEMLGKGLGPLLTMARQLVLSTSEIQKNIESTGEGIGHSIMQAYEPFEGIGNLFGINRTFVKGIEESVVATPAGILGQGLGAVGEKVQVIEKLGTEKLSFHSQPSTWKLRIFNACSYEDAAYERILQQKQQKLWQDEIPKVSNLFLSKQRKEQRLVLQLIEKHHTCTEKKRQQWEQVKKKLDMYSDGHKAWQKWYGGLLYVLLFAPRWWWLEQKERRLYGEFALIDEPDAQMAQRDSFQAHLDEMNKQKQKRFDIQISRIDLALARWAQSVKRLSERESLLHKELDGLKARKDVEQENWDLRKGKWLQPGDWVSLSMWWVWITSWFVASPEQRRISVLTKEIAPLQAFYHEVTKRLKLAAKRFAYLGEKRGVWKDGALDVATLESMFPPLKRTMLESADGAFADLWLPETHRAAKNWNGLCSRCLRAEA